MPVGIERVARWSSFKLTHYQIIGRLLQEGHITEDEAVVLLSNIRGSIEKFDSPLEPACDPDEWEANRYSGNPPDSILRGNSSVSVIARWDGQRLVYDYGDNWSYTA